MKQRFHTRTSRRQRGAALPMLILLIGAGLATAAFVIDSARMNSNAAQLKRATDAAAIAVAQAAARSPDAEIQNIAERYIAANMGMDQAQLSNQLKITLEPVVSGDAKGYRVAASFVAMPALLTAGDATVQVASAAVARYSPVEVALMQPLDVSLSSAEVTAMKKLDKDFLDYLFDYKGNAGSYEQDKDIWASLVPYSQTVNVYDAQDPDRIHRWARSKALNPVELSSLFRSGKATSLADNRIPDRVAKLLCVYRGLGIGQNFFWDQGPISSFGIYYRADLPENGSPGATPISWLGPNPMFGMANGVEDIRWMVADRGCPAAALLPLSADRDKLFERIDAMKVSFNVNYAIAMSWAAASLSPNMRGNAGWGDGKLPLDFNEDGRQPNQKVIIMQAKIAGDWMDSDAYNHELGVAANDSKAFSRQRFLDLCNSFVERKLRFYFIGVQAGNPKDAANTNFGEQAIPGMTICAADNGKLSFFDGSDVRQVSANIAARLQEIADDIKRDASFVRLIE